MLISCEKPLPYTDTDMEFIVWKRSGKLLSFYLKEEIELYME